MYSENYSYIYTVACKCIMYKKVYIYIYKAVETMYNDILDDTY